MELDEQVKTSKNELVGRTYEFVSSTGMNWRAFFNSRIIGKVEVTEDRLILSKKPKRMNKVPAVFLEDIIGIDISVKISGYWIWFIIFALFYFVFTGGWEFLILTVVFAWIGINRKITIMQRNGVKVVIYSRSKEEAIAFKEDMKTIVHIQ